MKKSNERKKWLKMRLIKERNKETKKQTKKETKKKGRNKELKKATFTKVVNYEKMVYEAYSKKKRSC